MAAYTITDAQQASFLEQGYLRLENAVPPELLAHWQDLATRLERKAMADHQQGHVLKTACVVQDPVGPRVMRIDDILVQDMMILHGSQPKRSPGVRRTIYVELRPFEGILDSAEQSPAWAALRQQWMHLVLQEAAPDAWPEEWRADYPDPERSAGEIIGDVVAQREPPTPAVWGIEPVETEDYPVPVDMKGWGIDVEVPG